MLAAQESALPLPILFYERGKQNPGGRVEPGRYRAFISYSHGDLKVARWLHRAIETYRPPKAVVGQVTEYGPVPPRMGKVFRDEEELAGAPELGGELEDAIRRSDSLIVICSPRSARSRWVDHEIRFFKLVNPDKPVLAVIALGEPEGENCCFPDSLRHAVTPQGEIDRAQSIEPLAPDLQKLGHAAVKLKLIAALLGVGYDDLARRELKRARQLTIAVTAISTTIVVIMAGLTGWALDRTRIAQEQTKLAREKQAQAEKSQWLLQAELDAVSARLDVVMSDGQSRKVALKGKATAQ
jgi:hypothetical protein